jgi:CubicO group peptidase (beta-lactamase class C family)
MQLVEQGKLDLDRDVNDYLDFPIPKTYPEPVTLRPIAYSNGGFEETLKNLSSRTKATSNRCARIS